MHRSLIFIAISLVGLTPPAQAHALFPGEQTVRTFGDRALVRFQALNGRRDVMEFAVEIFDGDSWTPSRIAVASSPRLIVPASDPGSTEASDRTFSVLVDLDGKQEQKLRVCTKSVIRTSLVQKSLSRVNTRVCANVIVKRF